MHLCVGLNSKRVAVLSAKFLLSPTKIKSFLKATRFNATLTVT